jgi:crotonobetainyl-CoA:carnitine CoA-transferase CaiB-like acyl-CoA transferase
VTPRPGNQTRAEWGIFPCADGYIGFFALQRQIRNLFEAMDDPELYDGPFMDPMYRLEHHEELLAKMYVFTADKTKDQLIAIGRQHKVPVGSAVTPADLLEGASLVERGFWDQVETVSGTATVPGRPFSGVGWRPLDRLHAPGEDTSEIMHSWLAEDDQRRDSGVAR